MAFVILSSDSTTIRWVWLLSFLFLFISQSSSANDQFNFNLGRVFSRKLCPSCSSRRELYPFFRHSPGGHADGDLMHMSTSSYPDRNRKKHKTWSPIGASLSVAAVGVLLVSTLWHMTRGNAQFEEEQENNPETGSLDSREGSTDNENCSYGCLPRENVSLSLIRKTVPSYFLAENFKKRRGKKKYISAENKIRNQMEDQDFPLFPLDVTLAATDRFSDENKIGVGGFGSVYKGRLPDGELIAVKRLVTTSGARFDAFLQEATVLSKLKHKNVVRLLGCCIVKDEGFLILEYMANRNLNDVLFESSMGRGLLTWKTRLNIINGVARGLSYMHEDSRLKIIHRDIKPSNVLLDDNMNPKISDFGMAKLIHEYESEGDTTCRIVGTFGYMAPEYWKYGQYSIKSDVYGFGILLLETIAGEKNTRFSGGMRDHIWNLCCEGKALGLMDPELKESCNLIEIMRCIHIGLMCTEDDPGKRPTMSTVVVMLASDDVKVPQPTQPAFLGTGDDVSILSQSSSSSHSSSNIQDVSINEGSISSFPTIEG